MALVYNAAAARARQSPAISDTPSATMSDDAADAAIARLADDDNSNDTASTSRYSPPSMLFVLSVRTQLCCMTQCVIALNVLAWSIWLAVHARSARRGQQRDLPKRGNGSTCIFVCARA
jgi:hypothetical protein